jgi:transcription elongation factor Elf1
MDSDTEYEYSFCCPDCGARVSLGQALRGGKLVCTTCGCDVPLPRRTTRVRSYDQ